MRSRRRFSLATLFTLIASLAAQAQDAEPYWAQKPQAAPDFERFSLSSGLIEVEELPNLPNASGCSVYGLNNVGTIVGYCGGDYYTNTPNQGYIFNGGQARGYLFPPAYSGWTTDSPIADVMDDDTLLLRHVSADNQYPYPSVRRILLVNVEQDAVVVDSYPDYYGPQLGGINNARQVVGYENINGFWDGWLWQNGQRQAMPKPPNADWMQLHDISDKGHIVGYYSGANMAIRPLAGFVYFEGKHYPITIPGYNYAYVLARGVNSYGDVVGYYHDYDAGVMRGFLLHAGKFYVLKVTAGQWDNLYPQGINDNGEIVANSRRWDDAAGRYVTSMVKITLTLDHDEDGLPTKWGREGLKDEQGNVILDLPAMGADPLHKDLFVQVDYMENTDHTHKLSTETARNLTDSFAAAPVSNPDGDRGIHLHIDAGSDHVMNLRTEALWGDLSRASHMPHSNTYGVLINEQRLESDIENIMVKRLGDARLRVFRYVLMAHAFGGSTVALGASPTPSQWLITAMGAKQGGFGARDEARVLLHELGHSLGLGHSGDAAVPNFEPNYLSVMNYTYTRHGLERSGSETLDFSRFTREDVPDLDESALYEDRGVTSTKAAEYKYIYFCHGDNPNTAVPQVRATNRIVDWNCDLNYDGLVPPTSINGGTNAAEVLSSHNDWDALKFAADRIGALGLAVHQEDETQTTIVEVADETPFTDLLPSSHSIAMTRPSFKSVSPGTHAVYEITVTNQGTAGEQEMVEFFTESSRRWTNFSNVPRYATLQPRGSITFAVLVDVPMSAMPGDFEEFYIVMRSVDRPTVSSDAQIKTHVIEGLKLKANAGHDLALSCASPAGTRISLDGAGSEGESLSYTWSGMFGEATGVHATALMPIGTSTVTLTVSDGTHVASDTLDVSVHTGVTGFAQPLSALVEEGQQVVLPDNAFKQGRTLPLKLTLACGNEVLTDAHVAPPRISNITREGEALALDTINLDAGQANDSGYTFRSSEGQWVYNLGTQSQAPGTYHITIALPDGRNVVGGFVLR